MKPLLSIARNQKTHEMREHAKEKIAEKNDLIEKIKTLRDEKEVLLP